MDRGSSFSKGQNTMTVRTRLAPSPTSSNHSLHVGNVRTGLFAYLYAKKHGGVFYLRIEDSDVARNVDGCAKGMLDDLHWLGLSPDRSEERRVGKECRSRWS